MLLKHNSYCEEVNGVYCKDEVYRQESNNMGSQVKIFPALPSMHADALQLQHSLS